MNDNTIRIMVIDDQAVVRQGFVALVNTVADMVGVEAIIAIRKEFRDARLIVLTTYDGDEDIYRSLQAGAQGYLLKDVFFEELEDAIRKVHMGLRWIPTQVAKRLAERIGSSDL